MTVKWFHVYQILQPHQGETFHQTLCVFHNVASTPSAEISPDIVCPLWCWNDSMFTRFCIHTKGRHFTRYCVPTMMLKWFHVRQILHPHQGLKFHQTLCVLHNVAPTPSAEISPDIVCPPWCWNDSMFTRYFTHTMGWNFTRHCVLTMMLKCHQTLCAYHNVAGPVPALLIIETILEHVAKAINKHPIDVKELNLYQRHQVAVSATTVSFPVFYVIPLVLYVWCCRISTVSVSLLCLYLCCFCNSSVSVTPWCQPPRWPSGKAFASILGSNPAGDRIFSGSSHTSDFKIGTPVAILPGAWCYRVSAGTGRPGVSILWLGEMESLICSFHLSVAAHKIVCADPSPWYTRMLLGR